MPPRAPPGMVGSHDDPRGASQLRRSRAHRGRERQHLDAPPARVSREIEELTGRKVIGFMSDNHIDPDLAVEVFVLEPLPRPAIDPQLLNCVA
jgi:uncharacterized protein YbcI